MLHQLLRVELPLAFDGELKIGGEALFAFLAVQPFWNEQDGHEVPHVSLQLVDGVWLPALSPEQLADVISKLRGRLDDLEHQLLPQLVQARANRESSD